MQTGSFNRVEDGPSSPRLKVGASGPGSLVSLQHWYMLPISILIATTAMASGVGRA